MSRKNKYEGPDHIETLSIRRSCPHCFESIVMALRPSEFDSYEDAQDGAELIAKCGRCARYCAATVSIETINNEDDVVEIEGAGFLPQFVYLVSNRETGERLGIDFLNYHKGDSEIVKPGEMKHEGELNTIELVYDLIEIIRSQGDLFKYQAAA